jgi:alpha-galactosidase
MPPKITFIGAGSTVFARALLQDLFTFPELRNAEIALMDIDTDRLRDSEIVANRLALQLDASPSIRATTDRRSALDGADYVLNMIQVGGYEPATVIDFEIPKKYGLRQTIGDTLGIGGIMRALRTIRVMLDIGLDMEELAPDALLLNYTNPMAMLTGAMGLATDTATVGLCHSVFGTAEELAGVLGLPVEEITYRCAGINHMAFYLTFEHNGRDLYPELIALANGHREPPHERVRYEVLRRFGYFVTESSEHFSEYVPWFIKPDRPELIEQFNIPLDEYPARCEEQIAGWTGMREALLSQDDAAIVAQERAQASTLSGAWERRLARVAREDAEMADRMRTQQLEHRKRRKEGHSGEYGSLIIHSMETGQPRVVYGNVMNDGLIDNLPSDCVVEVPCLVDASGVQPVRVGRLPTQLAALMQTNINVQALTVEAALTGIRDRIYQAALLDPHTAAVLAPDQIVQMVDDLLDAYHEWLPDFN